MVFLSASVAGRTSFFRGWTILLSSTWVLAMATSPYSRPRAVSTITGISFFTWMPQGSK